MVIDPWGDMIAQMSDREGYFVCELDFEYLDKVRGNMLCLNQVTNHESYNNMNQGHLHIIKVQNIL